MPPYRFTESWPVLLTLSLKCLLSLLWLGEFLLQILTHIQMNMRHEKRITVHCRHVSIKMISHRLIWAWHYVLLFCWTLLILCQGRLCFMCECFQPVCLQHTCVNCITCALKLFTGSLFTHKRRKETVILTWCISMLMWGKSFWKAFLVSVWKELSCCSTSLYTQISLWSPN